MRSGEYLLFWLQQMTCPIYQVTRHEHIYTEVENSLICTDELPKNPRETKQVFHRVRIILCTLSALSNLTLEACCLFKQIPIENLVVDEASQIGIFDYLVW